MPNTRLYEKATIYLEAGDNARAEKWYKKLFKLEPDHPEGCLNYGAILKGRGDLKGALRYFLAASSSRPSWAAPYNNIGLIYHNWNMEDKAVPYFRKAISLDSEYADAHWNLALSLLKSSFSGRTELLEEGWMHYSWRFRKSGPVKLAVVPSLPIYTTGSAGRCLVVAEQGFGDVIMMLPSISSNMTVYTDGRFSELFDALGINWTDSVEGFDTWIPMMSLAAFAPKRILKKLDGGSGIGVCWAGNHEHANDANRSRTDSSFAWLEDAKSFQFGVTSRIFGESVTKSWADSVSELKKLRCLVTVDTSIAHLAGYLGVPTCVLVPNIDTDFRWGLGRKDCYWYPSVTVARSMQEVKDYVNNIKT